MSLFFTLRCVDGKAGTFKYEQYQAHPCYCSSHSGYGLSGGLVSEGFWSTQSGICLPGQLAGDVLGSDQRSGVEFWLPPRYYACGRSKVTEAFMNTWYPLVQKAVRRGSLAVFAPTLRSPQKIPALSRDELNNLQREMCKTETGHLAIGLIVILMAGYALLKAGGCVRVVAVIQYPVQCLSSDTPTL